MKYLLHLPVFLLLLLATRQSQAQQSTRLTDHWEWLRQDIGGIWEAVRPVAPGSPESVPQWQPVRLPHCVNGADAVDPDAHYYQGPAWYRTQLRVDNPYTNGRTLLHFEGAGQKTDVYVYTTRVGTHTGGYDEFTIDITDAVNRFKANEAFTGQFGGKIPISIRTDNSRDLEMIPSSMSDFMVYGGIYRYLNLVYVPPVSFDKLFVTPELDQDLRSGRLQVKARIYSPLPASGITAWVKLVAPGGKIIQQAEKKLSSTDGDIDLATFTVKAPELWSPDNPKLYRLEAGITCNGITATQTAQAGFRRFGFVTKGPFLLNGERLLLRGTHRHEDHAGVGAAMTEAMIRTELLLMKEMGVNFVRLGHYQQSRIVLNLCDSLGILVWEEIPWCRGGLGQETYKEQARRMLTNMIEQHYNHPSIIIWGLGNENDWPGDFAEFDREKIRAFMKELHRLSHKLDNSRLTAIRRCDFCKDIPDIYSPSIWAGWYRGIYTEYKSATEAEFNKTDRFLHAEWGGDSHAGRHSENPDNMLQQVKTGDGNDERTGDASLFGGSARVSKDGDWSESYIVNLFDWHLKEQETMPWLTGSAQWVFKDFATPLRPDNPVPYVNQKGVLERDFTKKESYYVFQSYWSSRPMAHIYGHTWPVRWGKEGELKMVKVYSNATEAELFVNGRSYGRRTRNVQDFPAAGFHWNVSLVKGTNHVHVVAKKGKTVVEDSLIFQYQTEPWGRPAKMLLEKIQDVNDTAIVQVRLVDEYAVPCLDARSFVRFGLAGDGRLVDNLGTAKGSRYVQLANGRAEIRIQKNRGVNVVSVQCEGLPSVLLRL